MEAFFGTILVVTVVLGVYCKELCRRNESGEALHVSDRCSPFALLAHLYGCARDSKDVSVELVSSKLFGDRYEFKI